MRERPILFSGAMVRAILEGRKTQTRRVVKPQPHIDEMGNFCWNGMNFGQDGRGPHVQAIASPLPSSKTKRVHCPYGRPGDRLWVRENGWERPDRTPKMMREGADTWERYYYDADGLTDLEHEQFKEWGFKRRPSIHMPRWASRLLLEVTAVRVERLRDISEADAKAEGVDAAPEHAACSSLMNAIGCATFAPYATSYARLWENINGAGSWSANPWVWVVECRRIEP